MPSEHLEATTGRCKTEDEAKYYEKYNEELGLMTTMTGEKAGSLERNGVLIVDTFAEAFDMRAARVVITASSAAWRTAAQSMTAFATSVIGCKIEVASRRGLSNPTKRPTAAPASVVLIFGFDAEMPCRQPVWSIASDRAVLTCPTTAAFYGLPDAADRATVGGQLRHFGDKYQASKVIPGGRRYWRIPVMDGEFIVDDQFGVQKAIGGGNFLILVIILRMQRSSRLSSLSRHAEIPRRDSPLSWGHRAGGKQSGREKLRQTSRVNERHWRIARHCGGAPASPPRCRQPPMQRSRLWSTPASTEPRSYSLYARDSRAVPARRRGNNRRNYGGKLGKHHFHLHALLAS